MLQPSADGESHIRVGKLNMVDLAGSERQSKTGATVCTYFIYNYFFHQPALTGMM